MCEASGGAAYGHWEPVRDYSRKSTLVTPGDFLSGVTEQKAETADASAEKVVRIREKEPTDVDYSHPVYKQISIKNGEINRMSKPQLRHKLEQLKLDTRGVKDVLKKRLKAHYKRQKLMAACVRPPRPPKYDYYLVIDFEATCEETNPSDYQHEIIEFPAILIDAHQRKVVSEFHSYVRPVLHPRLTPFCTQLTGITQDVVDHSPYFPDVLDRANSWMAEFGMGKPKGKKFAVVTDGPWDMSRFMLIQCRLSNIPFPSWARRWINLRKSYCRYYKFQRTKLEDMLQSLGMSFEGQMHSGIDDTRNITRVTIRMLEDGCVLQVNERLFEQKACSPEALEAAQLAGPPSSGDDSDNDCCAVCSQTDRSTQSLEAGMERLRVGGRDSCTCSSHAHALKSRHRNTVPASEQAQQVLDMFDKEEIDDLMTLYALKNS